MIHGKVPKRIYFTIVEYILLNFHVNVGSYTLGKSFGVTAGEIVDKITGKISGGHPFINW